MSSPSPSLYSIPITSVVAVTPSWGIGKSGTVPWHCADVFLPSDLKYFRDATTHTADKSKRNAVLMGRLTWESIPLKNRPLKNRLNVVISSTLSQEVFDQDPVLSGVLVASSLEDALSRIEQSEGVERAVVVGGARLFEESLFHRWFDTLHLTQVDREFDSDTFLPPRTVAFLQAQDLEPYVTQRLEEGGVRYRIVELPVKSCTPINSQLDSPV